MVKKGKGPPLTPEEKKKKNAEKKLAKKLAKEEKLRQQKRDHLQREISFGNTNRKILEQKWRDIQMAIQLPYLQTQFQFAVNKSECVLDLKDYQISLLMDELDEADEQYSANFKAHMHNINKVIDYFHAILDDVKREYENAYSNLVQQARQERYEMQKKFDNQADYLNIMTFRLAEERNKMGTDLKSEYIAKIELEQKQAENEIHIMSDGKSKTFINVWDQCNKVVEAYQASIKDQLKEYEYLENENIFFRKIISEQGSRIYDMHKQLYLLQERQAVDKEKWLHLMECKKNENNFFREIYHKLRANLNEDLKLDTKQITLLVVESNEVIKILSKTEEQCGKVVKLHSFMRKYETQQEKYRSFPISLPESLVAHIKTDLLHAAYTKELRSFWMKCSQADALRHIICEEYVKLKSDNRAFKKLLTQYCTMKNIC